MIDIDNDDFLTRDEVSILNVQPRLVLYTSFWSMIIKMFIVYAYLSFVSNFDTYCTPLKEEVVGYLSHFFQLKYNKWFAIDKL